MIPGTDIEKPEVELSGQDGNAFAVMGRVSKALKRAGASEAICKAYRAKAMSGDYEHLLGVSGEYADIS